MNRVALDSWQHFEAEVDKLSRFLTEQRAHGDNYVSRPIFRGQSRATWDLQTSLERYVGVGVSLERYNRYLLRIKPAVETYTGCSWHVERCISMQSPFSTVPNYEFMLYARHHGFPSPLLDWSESPYVAIFFAYQHALPDEPVSIYAYVETLGHGKGGIVGAPMIFAQGPYVSSHRRHFMQQSQYTIAMRKVDERWVYCPHDDYFKEAKDSDQDLLIKFTLPGKHKVRYLQKLQQMNINAFTLFGTEESLMKMLAFREIIEREL